jgi:hypothetical protein
MTPAHKFRPGQSVELVGGGVRPRSLGRFKIVRMMPSEHGIQQYRIKSLTDGHERMATEAELA